jgi:hypothetical protein
MLFRVRSCFLRIESVQPNVALLLWENSTNKFQPVAAVYGQIELRERVESLRG